VGSDLVSRILTGNEFQTLGAENRKARDPKVKLWRGTESWWELDERRDLVGSWYWKRSERYGGDGRRVCNTLKVKVASLNRIHHSIGSQWSWLRSSVEESAMTSYRRRWTRNTFIHNIHYQACNSVKCTPCDSYTVNYSRQISDSHAKTFSKIFA